MRNIILSLFVIFIFSCNSNTKENASSNTNIVADFLNDISSLEDIEGKNPIVLFQESAENKADKIISLSKDNIKDVLDKAKEFKYCVVIVGDHTILKIEDLEDCKQSGSWAACMPSVEGYIKKNELVYQEDYMNNIIGLPDGQSRTAYLFN